VDDRWRITAYIRALELSQNAPPELAGQAGNEPGGGAQPGGSAQGGHQ
jgi:hypothetical protein